MSLITCNTPKYKTLKRAMIWHWLPKDKCRVNEKRANQKEINIIKENTIHNLDELNIMLLEILKADRDKMIQSQQETALQNPLFYTITF